jgi:branched-chain amino acid transport system ATP-binding protein
MTTLLTCADISVHFEALAAIDRLSFTVERGQVLGIGGPNGAGKTTLFDVICGLVRPTAGRVLLNGVEITRLRPDRICQLGVARTFQLNAAFDSLTVRENVLLASCFGYRPRLIPPVWIDKATRARVDGALEATALLSMSQEPVAMLPVLYRKLLMIAGALVTDPQLVLMDEPVGGLNPGEIERIAELVEQLAAQGTTIVLIEHVMRFLIRLSDRVMIMHHGQKIFEGAPRAMISDSAVVETYLGVGSAQALQQWLGSTGR